VDAAAAAVAAAFPGGQGSTVAAAAAAAALPFDPFAQRPAAAAAAAATAAGAYANWRQGQHAEYLCIRAEDIQHGAELPWDGDMKEQMLQAFFAQYTASNPGTTADDEQWLREYLDVPDASYEDCWDDSQGTAAAQAGSSSMLGSQLQQLQEQQQQQGQQQPQQPAAVAGRAAGSGIGKGGKGAVGGAAAASTAPIRRSGRQHRVKDPLFAADINVFAALGSQDQQQKKQQQKQQQQPQQIIPLTPQQADRPRPGRSKQ
jgi:hypothetical protein